MLNLNGYVFNWKTGDSVKKDAGLVAQEVKEVFPEAVFQNKSDGYYGINYSRFPALFVEAMKEQQKLIEKQQEQINDLIKANDQLTELIKAISNKK